MLQHIQKDLLEYNWISFRELGQMFSIREVQFNVLFSEILSNNINNIIDTLLNIELFFDFGFINFLLFIIIIISRRRSHSITLLFKFAFTNCKYLRVIFHFIIKFLYFIEYIIKQLFAFTVYMSVQVIYTL